nr:uncharacterized protein LOC109185906 [Ipomoea batatas]
MQMACEDIPEAMFANVDSVAKKEAEKVKAKVTEEEVEVPQQTQREFQKDLRKTQAGPSYTTRSLEKVILKSLATEELRSDILSSSPREVITTLKIEPNAKGIDDVVDLNSSAKDTTRSEYEYIDVIVEGKRVLIDVDFRSEFEIARSMGSFKAILQLLPFIFVEKFDWLQQIVSIVSGGVRLN